MDHRKKRNSFIFLFFFCFYPAPKASEFFLPYFQGIWSKPAFYPQILGFGAGNPVHPSPGLRFFHSGDPIRFFSRPMREPYTLTISSTDVRMFGYCKFYKLAIPGSAERNWKHWCKKAFNSNADGVRDRWAFSSDCGSAGDVVGGTEGSGVFYYYKK